MSDQPIFISHSSKDDAFVKELREALEIFGLQTWADSRQLRSGDRLEAKIVRAIKAARQVIVVLSPNTINSPWVRKEVQKALKVQKQRQDESYRVIPLMLPGIEPSALPLWFGKEPVGLKVDVQPGGLSTALPAIFSALGEQLPADYQAMLTVDSQPVEELILRLNTPSVTQREGKREVSATAKLIYEPATQGNREIESPSFDFIAPLGPIEADDLRWYLERYYHWPVGVFHERAERIKAKLPEWGKLLYEAILGVPEAREPLEGWRAARGAEQRFSVLVDSGVSESTAEEKRINAQTAASDLLALPWELLHDGRSYLFQGARPAHIRRRFPNLRRIDPLITDLPIRVLLVSPRPEDEYTGYFDHRSSALPLVEAVESLGALVTLSVLTPPTFPALREALKRAKEAGQPFDVVHFDGHGVYDRKLGLGGLCFEDPQDFNKLQQRRMAFVDAQEMAAIMRDYRIPLVFLDACQTAKIENDPTASVAARLLEEGVSSVVAMSHSVLVPTAERFVRAFYGELARGARVGAAMLAGQQALHDDTYRLKIMGAGDLHLQDWFVPVLYQEQHDPQLITKRLPDAVQQMQTRQRSLSLGDLPPAPPHHFQGRSRELLALERLLHLQPYVVLRGQGGAGKTTLAVELARWLVRTHRFRRAAFVSVESSGDARTVLDALGRQLVPNYSVAQYPDLKQALQPVERALRDFPTLIVLDNLESVLPDKSGQSPAATPVEELLTLCQTLLNAHPQTRLLFTSREGLPAPFNQSKRTVLLGALSREDAIALVGQVMAQEGLTPEASDPGGTPEEVTELVEAVNRHARALVLLAREVAQRGVRSTTENLRQIMADLERAHPGERENSLYASVELSLRRLTTEQRQQVRKLGVFHGGAQFGVIAHVLELEEDAIRALAIALVEVGLAADMDYGHLRLDPALAPYLLNELSIEEQQVTRERWGAAMAKLTQFLYQQRSKNAQLSAHLTLLELPNLLELLRWIEEKLSSEEITQLAGLIEQLLANLDRPQAMAQAIRIRETAARRLGGWSSAQFEAARLDIERVLEQGDVQTAHTLAQQLLQRSLDAGEEAYEGAAYDLAIAFSLAGDVLAQGGQAEEALRFLAQAQQRFQQLADGGNTSALRMVGVVISQGGRSLINLGRLDEAATAYEAVIKHFQELGDERNIASAKGNFGTVRLLQGRYDEALQFHEDARDIFDNLGEPRMVATAWNQIGRVHSEARHFEQAEQAYRQSLGIRVQLKDLKGQADSLTNLGVLSDRQGRLEEAVIFGQQAADIDVALGDTYNEGIDRSNVANILIKLQRYDVARRELQRAIECKQPYGHNAHLWKTWNILYDLEQATNNPHAAAQARQQAIESYAAYRRAGGVSQSNVSEWFTATFQALQQGQAEQVEKEFAQLLQSGVPQWAEVLIPKLQAILRGDRDPALADDPDLDYDDAVELKLLLEQLAHHEQE